MCVVPLVAPLLSCPRAAVVAAAIVGASGAAASTVGDVACQPSEEKHCDSISCDKVPHSCGGVDLILLRLGWPYHTTPLPFTSRKRRTFEPPLGDCRRWHRHFSIDWGLVSNPAAVAALAAPARRLRFGGRYGFNPTTTLNITMAAPISKAGAFSIDHRVFGSYGSLWTFLELSNQMFVKWNASTPLDSTVPAQVCLQAIRYLADAESAILDSGDLKLRILELVTLVRSLAAALDEAWQGFASCIVPALAWLISSWLHDGDRWVPVCDRVRHLVAHRGFRSLSKAVLRHAGCDLDSAAEELAGEADEDTLLNAVPVWTRIARESLSKAMTSPRPVDEDNTLGLRRWRNCGPTGSTASSTLVRNRLRAVILGAWGTPGASGRLGVLELSLFIGSTEGCVYIDGQRLYQTLPQSYMLAWRCRTTDGRVSSNSFVASYSGTVVVVTCSFDDSQSSAVATAEDIGLTLEADSQRLRDEGWVIGPFDLCATVLPTPALPRVSPQPQVNRVYARWLTVCSEVLYTLKGPHRAALVIQWLEYHKMIGVDHFVLYDRDGSINADGTLDPYIDSGYVTYFPRFPALLSADHQRIHGVSGLPSHAAPDAQAVAHCLFLTRGVSDWVSFLHSPDEYISNAKGLRHISEILVPIQPLRDAGLAVLDMSQVYFGRGPEQTARPSPILLARYIHRDRKPIQLEKWGSLRPGTFLNRFASPIVDPLRVADIVSAHYPRAQPDALYIDDVPQSFARANHYSEAFGSRNVMGYSATERVFDDSALWAEQPMLDNPAVHPLPN